MEKKLLAEAEGRYVRQSSSVDHFAIVKLQVYAIDTEEVVFQNCCTPEQLPTRFVNAVEKQVCDFSMESGILKLLVCLTDAGWHAYDSHEQDFNIATLLALLKIFPKKK